MTFRKIFGILVVLSLAMTGFAMARDISNGAAGKKANSENLVKGDKVTAKSAQEHASARHARPQSPIVMGRSVSAHHKTKLHHIKMKPLESIETPVAADNSR